MAQRKAQREWYLRNKDKMKQKRLENYDDYRDSRMKRLYGIGLDEYNIILEVQNGLCAICRLPGGEGRQRLQVDHCHGSGRVRGLLCPKCNKVLGLFHDDPERFRRALEFLGAS